MSDQPPRRSHSARFSEDIEEEPEVRSLPSRRVPFASGREYLNQLLSERNQLHPRTDEIDEQILSAFERKVAILVMDMCGFTELTMKYGIIHFLAMIRQMEEVAEPAVSGNGGQVIKQEADNLFAAFADPAQAIEGALDILRGFAAINKMLPPERELHGSIGIGYGETLMIGDDDMYGSEMNVACKLGEDIAERDEVLITPAAYTALPPGRYVCKPVRFALHDLDIRCYRYDHSIFSQ